MILADNFRFDLFGIIRILDDLMIEPHRTEIGMIHKIAERIRAQRFVMDLFQKITFCKTILHAQLFSDAPGK